MLLIHCTVPLRSRSPRCWLRIPLPFQLLPHVPVDAYGWVTISHVLHTCIPVLHGVLFALLPACPRTAHPTVTARALPAGSPTTHTTVTHTPFYHVWVPHLVAYTLHCLHTTSPTTCYHTRSPRCATLPFYAPAAD